MKIDFLAGTYTVGTGSEGIYACSFETNTGRIQIEATIDTPNPSYLKFEGHFNALYAVNELDDMKGAVSLFRRVEDRSLKMVGEASLTRGKHPCHVQVSKTHRLLFASNYSSGSLCVFRLDEAGSISALHQVVTYRGQGPNAARQSAPHIHSAFLNRKEDVLYVQDLGSDAVYVYQINGQAILTEKYRINTKPGGGPRHVAFSADERFLYVLLELTAEIAVYSNGPVPVCIQSIGINGEGFAGYNSAAAIRISADGRFLYATNRGDANCITVFKIEGSGGTLTFVASYPTDGLGPRDFNISPCGKYLFIANQRTNEILVYHRDAASGRLTKTSSSVQIPSPVCIEFY